MKFWVGVTDNEWFSFLSQRELDEVNFWQPSTRPPFTGSPTGMPFLFKLKSPNNAIAGGGFFVTYSTLPLSLAWEVFGEKNGAASLPELRRLLDPLMPRTSPTREIGCTVLSNVFYLPRTQWIHNPPGWAPNIVRGKGFDSTQGPGAEIWEEVGWRLTVPAVGSDELRPDAIIGEGPGKYGEPVLVRPRLGQSSFRVMVTDAYKRQCTMTGEKTLVALEAAHILPYADEGGHEVHNGLLLRADFHRLFDEGLVAVSPEYRIKVSPKIREQWFNGRAYYRLDGQPLAVLPDRLDQRPDRDYLRWHLMNRFQT
jgi:putative restriction endonuclease